MAIERELCQDCQCMTYEGNRTFGHREDGTMVELLHTRECPQAPSS